MMVEIRRKRKKAGRAKKTYKGTKKKIYYEKAECIEEYNHKPPSIEKETIVIK
jgi:hypothetical protein